MMKREIIKGFVLDFFFFLKERWQAMSWELGERDACSSWAQVGWSESVVGLAFQKAVFCGFHFLLSSYWCIWSGDGCRLLLGGPLRKERAAFVGAVQGSEGQKPWTASCLVEEATAEQNTSMDCADAKLELLPFAAYTWKLHTTAYLKTFLI